MDSTQPIPFVDLEPTIREVASLALGDFEDILRSHQFIQGAYVERLEDQLRSDLDASHAVACANGSDALILALRAVGVTPGMKIALPNVTFWATYEAVVHAGGVAVLVDIHPDDLQMDFDHFREAYETFHFEAAIAVHLFGWASRDLVALREFCQQKGIRLVEDAAQAYGVRVGGQSVFSAAGAATLSFFPSKVIGGAMDGGAILVRDASLASVLQRLRNHGRMAHHTHDDIGWNCRMANLQGAYLLRVCAIAERILNDRRESSSFYRDFFLAHQDLVRVHGGGDRIDENGYLNVITLPQHDPEEIARELTRHGIGCARAYPLPIDQQVPAKKALSTQHLNHSKRFCAQVINLPLYFGMPHWQRERAAAVLLQLVQKTASVCKRI